MHRNTCFSIFFVFFFFLPRNGNAQNIPSIYYTGKEYGSEALQNPFTIILNGGYDITQLQNVSNQVSSHNYAKLFKNVIDNLADPFPRIRAYGTKKFILELFPTGMSKETAPWIPNYTLHLIGNGMLYRTMKEWFAARNYPEPWLWSSVTMMTAHLLNETLETGPYEGYSVDEIADIYIFDLGGMILFDFDNVSNFFRNTLNLADWSLQCSYNFPDKRIHAGQFFSMKWKFPFSDDWSLFYRFGMGAIWGVSTKMKSEENLSFGIGFRTKHLVDLELLLRQRSIEVGWQAGVFYDRNNSLLASVVFTGLREYFCSVDLYPGVLKIGDFSPGLWGVIGLEGHNSIGISTKYLIGAGYGKY